MKSPLEERLRMYRGVLRQRLAETGVHTHRSISDADLLERVEDLLGKAFTDPLNEFTYVMEHSPNGPSSYMVRLIGRGRGVIDKLPNGESSDPIGYGMTFKEAADRALEKQRGK